MNVNVAHTGPRCCIGQEDKPFTHSSDCPTIHAYYSNSTTISSNLFRATPHQRVWQAAASYAHYQKVFHHSRDYFWTDAVEGSNICILGDRQRIMTYRSDGTVAHADMGTLRTLDKDGDDIGPEPHNTVSRRRSIDEEPTLVLPLDFSDSEEEDEADETRSNPVLHAQNFIARFNPFDATRGQGPHRPSIENTTVDVASLHDIPQAVKDTVTAIRSCPPSLITHGLPTRKWLGKKIQGITVRYAIFTRERRGHRLPIMAFVGDTRLFDHRTWAYLLYRGAALPQGEGQYEQEYFRIHGRTFGLVAEDFLAPGQIGEALLAVPESSVDNDSDRQSSLTASHRAAPSTTPSSTPAPIPYPLSTAGPFVGRGPCSDALIRTCSPNRQDCVHHAVCNNSICTGCDAVQLSHLRSPGETSSVYERSILLGALMPMCVNCQTDVLTRMADAKVRLPGLADLPAEPGVKDAKNDSQGDHVSQKEKNEPHACVCTSYQCLPCLRSTAIALASARDSYASSHRTSSIKLRGHHVDVYRCLCGKDIETSGVRLQNTGSGIDEVRVCCLCWGYKTRDEVLGKAKREFGLRGRLVEWWAGCEGFLR